MAIRQRNNKLIYSTPDGRQENSRYNSLEKRNQLRRTIILLRRHLGSTSRRSALNFDRNFLKI